MLHPPTVHSVVSKDVVQMPVYGSFATEVCNSTLQTLDQRYLGTRLILYRKCTDIVLTRY